MSKFIIFGIPFLSKGNKIHIKKKNRGKFTASAKRAGQSVLEHARSVLNNPKATPLQKKRANFARNAAKWKHEDGAKIHKPDGHPSILDNGWIDNRLVKKHATGNKLTKEEENRISDRERKLAFLENNRNTYMLALKNIPHKKAVTNVLLNEGYATNMINLGYTMNPDSLVITSNPSVNPGNTNYRKLGNFGLDYISNNEAKNVGIPRKKLRKKKAFDNTRVLLTSDKITLNLALPIINSKINDVKKWLYNKYGAGNVSKFLKEHPGSEDRLLYAGYKMPMKMKQRIDKHPNIEALYNLYITGGMNNAFLLVDKYRNTIDNFFRK